VSSYAISRKKAHTIADLTPQFRKFRIASHPACENRVLDFTIHTLLQGYKKEKPGVAEKYAKGGENKHRNQGERGRIERRAKPGGNQGQIKNMEGSRKGKDS
jgi:hypothetical protein